MLEELQKEIESKLAESGDKVLVALLSGLDEIINKLDISPDVKELYRDYVRTLFNYIRLKKIYHKYHREICYGGFSSTQYSQYSHLGFKYNQSKLSKDSARSKLQALNLPYKFLHPDFWDNLHDEENKMIYCAACA